MTKKIYDKIWETWPLSVIRVLSYVSIVATMAAGAWLALFILVSLAGPLGFDAPGPEAAPVASAVASFFALLVLVLGLIGGGVFVVIDRIADWL